MSLSDSTARSSTGGLVDVVGGGGGGYESVVPFVDERYVRLLNRGRGGYLYADESGVGVSTSHHLELINTVWRVQILRTTTGAEHVVLCGAYGRHLAAAPTVARAGHIGSRAIQCAFDTMDDTHVMWTTGRCSRVGDVILFNRNTRDGSMRVLRANGRHRFWNRAVTVQTMDVFTGRFNSMMEWEVQFIPSLLDKPPFQLGRATPRCWGLQDHGFHYIRVRCTIANYSGNFEGCGMLNFFPLFGNGLVELGNQLEERFGDGFDLRQHTYLHSSRQPWEALPSPD